MLDTRLPLPAAGRTFAASRRVRLDDTDRHGRLRLDAVARFLQDTAIDDVQETGWGAPEHLWFVRRIQLDVAAPFLDGPRGRARDLVQRPRGDRRRQALVGHGRPGRADRGRQRLDPSRPRPAAGADRGLRRLRRGHRRAVRLDEARPRGPAGGRAALALAAAGDRHRRPRPPQQRRLLAGGRAPPRGRRPRPALAPPGAARLPRAGRPGRPGRRRRRSGRRGRSLAFLAGDRVKAVARVEQAPRPPRARGEAAGERVER